MYPNKEKILLVNQEIDPAVVLQHITMPNTFRVLNEATKYFYDVFYTPEGVPYSNKTDLSTKADLVGGKVPASQLPSYVDDVLDFDTIANFPAVGEEEKIYVAKDTNITYRWNLGTSTYVKIGGEDVNIYKFNGTLSSNRELDLAGFTFTFKNLVDKSADASFNLMMAVNAAGQIAKSNGKPLIVGMPSLLSEAEKTTWKTQMNGGWTTATMSVAIITPPIVDKQDINFWVTIKGATLNLPPTSFSLEIMDSTGTNVLATVPNSQVQIYTNGLDLTFYYNFKDLPIGSYRIRLWNGVAYYTTGASVTINVVNLVNSVDIGSMTWTRKIYNNATSPAIAESGSSVLYRADPNIRPLGSDGVYIAARKSNEIIAANENFSMTVVFNGLAGQITNAFGADMFFMGLVPSNTNVDLLNQTITNIRFKNGYWYPMVAAYADLGGSINFNVQGSYTGRAIFTRNNGLWTILLEMDNTVVVYTKTGSMEALSFGMYNQNTMQELELNATITQLYKF